MWRTDFERAGWRPEDLRDGIEVVAAGGCDYYVGSASASPRFTFRVQELRLAGEGDLLARLERRSWAGELVWGYAPVQDRRAAPAIAQAIRDLAAVGQVDVIVVTRGGGSIADLWAFCDEALCRTVALLPVPVISAVGHDVDRTLIDDVSAVCCSTPTHAAEAAVGIDCAAERRRLHGVSARLHKRAHAAVLDRARILARTSRGPRDHLARHVARLHQ